MIWRDGTPTEMGMKCKRMAGWMFINKHPDQEIEKRWSSSWGWMAPLPRCHAVIPILVCASERNTSSVSRISFHDNEETIFHCI